MDNRSEYSIILAPVQSRRRNQFETKTCLMLFKLTRQERKFLTILMVLLVLGLVGLALFH